MKIQKQYYQIISCFFFALLGLQIKLVLSYSSIENIVFYRSFFGALFLLIIILISKKNLLILLNTSNIKIHIFRSFCGIVAMYFGYKSLMYLSLAQASTVGFTKVFFTCIISSYIFSEKISIKIVSLIVSGFTGIFLITNPEQIENNLGLYMSIISALSVSGGIIAISYLSKKEKTISILFYHSLISSVIFYIIFNQSIKLQNFSTLSDFILITVTALLGQFFNTESYKNLKTQKVVILSYSRIIFSALFGFLFFEDQITIINLFGILTIMLTTFMVQKK